MSHGFKITLTDMLTKKLEYDYYHGARLCIVERA